MSNRKRFIKNISGSLVASAIPKTEGEKSKLMMYEVKIKNTKNDKRAAISKH